jgi:orotidine-5'-phosphate decarboxylase
MTRQELFENIIQKKSFLCVGLDPDINKIPKFLHDFEDPIFEFNKRIIDATKDFCVSYKPNTAFYEALGAKGWESLRKTLEYIPKNIFTIADAKRGDIGNTSQLYAKAFFENLNADSLTIAPYMGEDSVKPFMYPGKWVIVLGLTSNPGAADFEMQYMQDGKQLFEKVLQKTCEWGTADNLMFVVGATRPQMLEKVRAIAPEHFLLIPGVGAQGGSLEDVFKYGATSQIGLLINASRSIIYASSGNDFAEKAGEEAMKLQKEMEVLLKEKGLV